jgi:hypothetical protein
MPKLYAVYHVRHDDVIFVANVQSVEATKFMQYLNLIITNGNNAITLGINSVTLRNMIRDLR